MAFVILLLCLDISCSRLEDESIKIFVVRQGQGLGGKYELTNQSLALL